MAGVKISGLPAFTSGNASKTTDKIAVSLLDGMAETQGPTIYEFLAGYMPWGLYVPGGFTSGLTNLQSFDDNYIIPLCVSTDFVSVETGLSIGSTNDPISRLDVRGVGALDSTRNVRFTNSAGGVLFEVKNGGAVLIGSSGQAAFDASGVLTMNRWQATSGFGGNYFLWGGGGGDDFRLAFGNTQNAQFGFNSYILGGIAAANGSLLTLTSTSKGFRPPLMTTAQFAAIGSISQGVSGYSSDDAGALWYDGTRVVGFRYNGTKFQGFDGGAWVDLN